MNPTTFIISFMIALSGLAFYQTHLLSLFLCLEGMALSVFCLMAISSSYTLSLSTIPLPLIMLTFSVCEAGLSLVLLVTMTRTHQNDLMSSLTLLKC
uniref:NADH-ubiquinone oxidoreductase chain 4L n=2 Tax=Myxine glutinosa TaxID=7769 RepID=NU4LM_MYXGL|nr:NADH dehydrogenase subunit 4L [Myxine glutinosa]Q9G2X0.1 RecName: Full=NADH-ubiquinone oxidoreductase chain 4L; AltName: Full=NADH dehydrogenase subunit 4L [Myxine glutinosa]QNH82463.1 NADH dehydrogenase subunit 4L [Myxine glutinosa]CAC20657.1 NADH dehydrogenase subunit 4L [Myxine glutinosa]